MTAFVIPNAIQITTRQAKYTFASFLSRDTTFDVVHNIWKLERPDDASISSGRGSYENPSMDQVIVNGAVAPVVVQLKKATQCACGRDGKHFSETAMETVFPGTPERIYNLIFASGFIKDFMAVNQKLLGASTLPMCLCKRKTDTDVPDTRYPNIRLGPDGARLEAAGTEHVVHQAAEREPGAEADQVRDPGRDGAHRL